MELLPLLLESGPYVVGLLILYLMLDKRLTKIETDLTWLKKELPSCRQTLDDPTH